MIKKSGLLKDIPGNVFVLGVVSFLTDVSGDMVYPLLSVFLTSYLGAGQMFVGLVEGVAESAAAIFKLVSGIWADRTRDRSKLVLFGYSLSSLTKPFLAIAWHPWVVLFARFSDRVGKGIRSSPRDALIADSVHPAHRGKAYGLHQSLDHAGAVVGPVIATVLLAFFIQDLRKIFWIATIPAFLAVALLVWKVREVRPLDRKLPEGRIALKFPRGRLRVFLAILLIFILSCSSDAFLLLRAKELGVPIALLPMIWVLMNGVMTVMTFPFGILSDRIGRRKVILTGWIVYTLVYFGFAAATAAWHAWVLFGCYGLFYALTDPSARAILADYAEPEEKGQAFGWYHFINGMGALPASLVFGAIWQTAGSRTAFIVSACVSAAAVLLLAVFLTVEKSPKRTTV